jgi:PAS domain S-box-containing protein
VNLQSIKSLIESGVNENDNPAKRRGVIFSNYIAIILCAANLLLFLIVPQNRNIGGFREAIIAIIIFAFPIVLNRLSLIDLSRLYLCWVPPILIMWSMLDGMKHMNVVPISSYDGIRIYLLATCCIPYLLMDRSRISMFIIGALPNFLLLLFCDPILDMMGVGFEFKGAEDIRYSFTFSRSMIAYSIISGTCIALRVIMDRTDAQNQLLISELEKKNLIIQQQAESELGQLNQQLRRSIEDLMKREVVLKRSQEIAKVGSWEYNLADESIFWSDQMYEIFGVDKSLDLQSPTLTEALFGESAPVMRAAIRDLIKEKKSYDFTLQTKTPLGYVKWIRIFGYPLLSNGEVVTASGIVHDITRYKESEEQLKINEKKYRSLFEQASDAILIIDGQGGLIDVNTTVCSMFGYSKDELLQLNVANLIDPEELKVMPVRFTELEQGEHLFRERRVVRKDGNLFYVEINAKGIDRNQIMIIARDITNRKLTEQEKEKTRYALNERVKELTTLYKISKILQAEKKPIHDVLQEITSILPDGWQFPKVTACRISLAGMEFVTHNFGDFKHSQCASFTTYNGLIGSIEIVYLEVCPNEAEGPFLAEERNLINMIADMIRIYLNQRYEADALKRTEANQSATINNTSFLIWSVNREYELISFNKTFAAFSKNTIGVDVQVGTRLSDGVERLNELRTKWTGLYNRALAGETFKINSEINDRQYEYSLSPITEDGKVIGVSVFGEDISDRIMHEKEMLAVNKQIGELRLMALRSAMNPHFVFNCLNSIQYYIMENDQVNAVMYLSTFSKLIRLILNNSVKNRVRLADEIEMLKHYVTLEAIRFENKFDFEINIDPEIDVESIEIPSMLIQPYVENSILHGLCNKKEKGLLKMSVSVKDGMILFEIEDNGIGREAASTLRQLNLSQHKSMGTALTEERLKLINDDTASVETLDLETDGKASGTKVTVWIKE